MLSMLVGHEDRVLFGRTGYYSCASVSLKSNHGRRACASPLISVHRAQAERKRDPRRGKEMEVKVQWTWSGVNDRFLTLSPRVFQNRVGQGTQETGHFRIKKKLRENARRNESQTQLIFWTMHHSVLLFLLFPLLWFSWLLRRLIGQDAPIKVLN